jgi:hypothetical protein
MRRGSCSRRSWSRAAAPRGRCSTWSSTPMWLACRPGRSINWSSRWGCGSRARRCHGSLPALTSRSRLSARGRWRAATRICGSMPMSRRSATAAGSGASASWSPTASARPRPDLRARVSARTRQARPGRRPTGDLGRPPRTQGWESTRMRRRAHVSVLLEDLIKCLMDPIGGAQSNLRDQGWLQIGAPRNPKPVDTLRNAQHRVEGASIG